MQGTIVKGIGGFYYVQVDKDVFECKARGKLRFNELTPMVGDNVEITVKNNKGAIENIYPRTNELIRPAVANVTQAFVVFTFANPALNLDLLNRFLVLCEYNDLKAIICFNKIDLIDIKEHAATISMLEMAGYEIIYMNAKLGYGLEDLEHRLKGNITVFCGPSGVGKSTLLNKLMGSEVMKTGDISEKIGRGKHTTRHSELVETDGGFIVDTPGFTSLELDFIERDELQHCYPEFNQFINKCKFTGCLHYKEPNCAVKDAVEKDEINKLRYEFYTKTLEDILNRRIRR
jgi:ribosome biogenesis GTPase